MADSTSDDRGLETLSVNPGAPASNQERDPRQDAGRDESIQQRLERDPESKEARLDNALDESMDASDPPSSTQPVHSTDPAPSSGYDPAAEAKRQG